jgi:DNA-binding beta-propeller fold protein YncE
LLTIELILLILILLIACGFLMFMYKPKGSGEIKDGEITWIRSVYGISSGTSGWDIIRPASVSINPGGNTFWVADGAFCRIIEFDMKGQCRKVIYDYSGTPFYYPTDIAVGPDGTLYVCEETYNHVIALDRNGKFKFEIKIELPTSVVVGRDMIVVGGKGGFAAYEKDGTMIGLVGGPHGKGTSQFDTVSGLVMDKDDNLYVVDSYNNRLSKYTKAGDRKWLVELGPPGNGGITLGRDVNKKEMDKRWPSAMQMPAGITMDGASRLIIADNLDYSFAIFDSKDGSFITKVGNYGMQDAKFYFPNDIAYDKASNYFVETEPSWGRLQIFSIDGSGGGYLGLGRTLGDLLRSCCWPLLILLLIVAIWAAVKRYRKYRDEKIAREDAEDVLVDAGIEPAAEVLNATEGEEKGDGALEKA